MSNQMLYYSLHNAENYKLHIQYDMSDVLKKYTLVVLEYLHFISENINIKKTYYYKFIILRGLATISHVFNIILYYTKNLDMAYYHSQKSFYFYVEFIGQITDDNNTFLQLSSRDAIMFVYKKTIFDLHLELHKISNMSNNDKNNTKMLHIYENIVRLILECVIENNSLLLIDFKRIEKILEKIYIHKFDNNILNNVELFIETYNSNSYQEIDKYYNIIDLFIKKILKVKGEEKYRKIREKILDKENFSLNVINNNEEFITWIFT